MNIELAELTKRIQVAAGLTGNDVDGLFGIQTAHAVLGKLSAIGGELTKQIQVAAGLTGNDVDGLFGIQTAHAVLGKLSAIGGAAGNERPPAAPASSITWPGPDQRSLRNIASLSSWVQPIARQFLDKLGAANISAQVTSGTRSYEDQDALYAQGRTTPGPIVTKARGGYSNHNFGLAFDITIFDGNGQPLDESLLYTKAGSLGKQMGLTWGGDWETFQDNQHFELRPGWARNLTESDMIAELRRRVAAGTSIA